MALAQGELLSNGSSAQMPKHTIFLRVQPKSAPSLIGVVAPVLSRLSLPESLVSTSGFDQTTARSVAGTRLSASDPTSALSGFPCNRSVVSASSATLLLLTQFLVCCIHRLNPPT